MLFWQKEILLKQNEWCYISICNYSIGRLDKLKNITIYYYDSVEGYIKTNKLEIGRGYLVRSDIDIDLELINSSIREIEINLNIGWNLIGSLFQYTTIDNLDKQDIIYKCNGKNYQKLNDIILDPGNAYWIKSERSKEIKLKTNYISK